MESNHPSGGLLRPALAERFFGFEFGRRQWVGIVLVAVSLALLAVTGQGGGGGDHSDYSVTAMIVFEGAGIALGVLFIFSTPSRACGRSTASSWAPRRASPSGSRTSPSRR